MPNTPLDTDLKTGSDTMDGEHEVQLGLVEALRTAVAEQRSADAVDEILDQLLEFTKVHFSSEELLMRLYAFDGYEAHVLEHESAIERIERLRDQYRAGEVEVSLDTVEAFGRWIRTHTHRSDRAFGGYLGGVGATGV